MARKTRKHKKSSKGIYSIPELRRAFEHIEQVMDEMIRHKESKATMVTSIRKEWSNVFHKTLDKASAEALISHRMESRHGVRVLKGGAAALAGAPVDYVTRSGIYLDQGNIPGPDGGLTKTVGGGGYGSYIQYVDTGFFNPEIGRGYDPVRGQTSFPLAPPADLGSNEVTPSMKGGKRRKTRKSRGGAAPIIQQALMRPIPADVPPPNPLADIQNAIKGIAPGASPDSTQNHPPYHIQDVYPKAVNISV